MRTMSTVALIATMSVGAAHAQPEREEPARPMRLADYLTNVLAANPDLRAARASIDIARAQIDVAKIFPDPEMGLGVSQVDVSRRGNPTMLGAQLGVPIELGGKRRARVAVARAGMEAAILDHADAVRILRGLAVDAFIDALHASLVLRHKQDALTSLQRLVDVNKRRLAAGDIAETELLQSRVERERFRAEVIAAEGVQRACEVALGKLLGSDGSPRIRAEGDLHAPAIDLDRSSLLTSLEKRSDVRAAAARVEAARRQVDLERAKRMIDVSLGVGWTHSLAVTGENGVPSADLVSTSVSVPLPLSRIYRGEIVAAENAQRQAESQLEAVRVRARAELEEALTRLDAATRRVALYDEGALVDAKSVLSKIEYSYQRGEATLIELLIAQRTATDVQLVYLDALAERAHALVAVAQAGGLNEDLLRL